MMTRARMLGDTTVTPSGTSPNALQAATQIYPPGVLAPTDPTVVASQAYYAAITKLAPLWLPLPIGPYPPAGDSTSFPRSGSPGLTITKAGVNAAQLAEPGKITQALNDDAAALVPKLNLAFVVGLGCLAGYLIIRRG